MALTRNEKLELLGTTVAAMVEDGMLVGLGTGTTAAAMIDALGKRVREGLSITGVATSNATRDQAYGYGIPLVELDEVDRLDLCIDGADEIDPELNLTKGHGGALLFEKLVARRANHYLIISSDEKLVPRLGTRMALPVEVVPVGWNHTAEIIAALGMVPKLRKDRNTPFITDGGHYILDCNWAETPIDTAPLARDIKAITGVVEHGLFIGMADTVVTIDADGNIAYRTR